MLSASATGLEKTFPVALLYKITLWQPMIVCQRCTWQKLIQANETRQQYQVFDHESDIPVDQGPMQLIAQKPILNANHADAK